MIHPLIAEDAERVASRVDLSPLADKAVLVTGASGLIGVNLIAALLRSPARCVMAASRSGMPDFAKSDDPWLVEMRFDKPHPDAPRPDVIIHAAGYGQPSRFMAEPLETIRVNVRMTDQLLGSLLPGGKFLFLSSSEVYSGSPRQPHLEGDIGTTAPDHPRGAYIEAKRCGEAVVHAHRAAGVDAKIARVSLAYGPGTKPDDARVLNQFIAHAICAGRIDMLDTGSAVRVYCYISDAVEMLLNVLISGGEAVYNIANPFEFASVRNLAGMVGNILDVPVHPGEFSAVDSAPARVGLDIGRYAYEFGRPSFLDLDFGLARTIEFQRSLY